MQLSQKKSSEAPPTPLMPAKKFESSSAASGRQVIIDFADLKKLTCCISSLVAIDTRSRILKKPNMAAATAMITKIIANIL